MPQSKKSTSGMGSIRKITKVVKGKEYTFYEARYTVGFDPGTGKQIQSYPDCHNTDRSHKSGIGFCTVPHESHNQNGVKYCGGGNAEAIGKGGQIKLRGGGYKQTNKNSSFSGSKPQTKQLVIFDGHGCSPFRRIFSYHTTNPYGCASKSPIEDIRETGGCKFSALCYNEVRQLNPMSSGRGAIPHWRL